MAIQCSKCSQAINVEDAGEPSPVCGSRDRSISVSDAGRGREGLKLKARDSNGRRLFEAIHRDKVSALGREAREEQFYDHRDSKKTVKRHKVEELVGCEWQVVHDETCEFTAKRRPDTHSKE